MDCLTVGSTDYGDILVVGIAMTVPIIALTGGIASGKTTVAHLFAELGAGIIDADIIARDVVAANTVGFNAIVAHFGSAILTPEGTLHRKRLRELIFQDPLERQWLETLLHPLIRTEMLQQASRLTTPYGILVIPLLKSPRDYPLVQRVIVVDIPEALQLERVQARDRVDLDQAKAILAAQPGRQARLAMANDVILNHGDLDSLRHQVERLHQQIVEKK